MYVKEGPLPSTFVVTTKWEGTYKRNLKGFSSLARAPYLVAKWHSIFFSPPSDSRNRGFDQSSAAHYWHLTRTLLQPTLDIDEIDLKLVRLFDVFPWNLWTRPGPLYSSWIESAIGCWLHVSTGFSSGRNTLTGEQRRFFISVPC